MRPETIQEGGARGMQEAMEVWGATGGRRSETIQEGGCRGMQEGMEAGEPPEGGPRQYRRAEVEGCRRPWK